MLSKRSIAFAAYVGVDHSAIVDRSVEQSAASRISMRGINSVYFANRIFESCRFRSRALCRSKPRIQKSPKMLCQSREAHIPGSARSWPSSHVQSDSTPPRSLHVCQKDKRGFAEGFIKWKSRARILLVTLGSDISGFRQRRKQRRERH